MKIGSSETTREAFNFSEYTKVKPHHIKNLDISFLEWFIGFVEGDGSFIVNTSTYKKRLIFCINQKDSQLMFKIKKKLGFGCVTCFMQNNQPYYRYAVYDFKNLTRLIHLFNGNLHLNKVNTRFQIWLSTYNSVNSIATKNYVSILYKQPNLKLSLDSAWLSGFVDAEGGFYASLTKQANLPLKYRLRLKFYITQKSELKILITIIRLIHENSSGVFLNENTPCNSAIFTENKYISNFKPDFYRLEISTDNYISTIIAYFEKYQLQGKKYIVFTRWKRIYINRPILKKIASRSEKSFLRFQKLVIAVQNTKN